METRKRNRLKYWDYSRGGMYFITICTEGKKKILSEIVGATSGRPLNVNLSEYGEIVENAILDINKKYSIIRVDKYVIMPNHIHLILVIDGVNWRAMHAPTISKVIQQFKGVVTKQIGHSIFQRSFHDHIIRNEQDYQHIWNYIDNNPLKWELDCFYE